MKRKNTALFTAVGGPFHAKKFWLEIDHPYTLVFSMKGQRGYYTTHRNNTDKLVWQSV